MEAVIVAIAAMAALVLMDAGYWIAISLARWLIARDGPLQRPRQRGENLHHARLKLFLVIGKLDATTGRARQQRSDSEVGLVGQFNPVRRLRGGFMGKKSGPGGEKLAGRSRKGPAADGSMRSDGGVDAQVPGASNPLEMTQ